MFVIIAAAGKGERMGGIKKQFLKINGRYILEISIEKFISFGIYDIVVAVASEDISFASNIIKKYYANIKIVEGKNTRQNTVINAFLQNCEKYSEKDLVIIHDAARPFFCLKDFKKLVAVAKEKKAAILAEKAVDTVKYGENFIVNKTLKRDNIYLSKTPQAFEISLYKKAVKYCIKNNFVATDDSQIVENIGFCVSLVLSSRRNFKITTKEDLDYAEFLIGKSNSLCI